MFIPTSMAIREMRVLLTKSSLSCCMYALGNNQLELKNKRIRIILLEKPTVCCGRIYRAKFLKWGSVEYSVSIPTAPAPPTADTNCKNIPLNFCLEDALSANKNHHSFDHKYFALIYLISGGDGYGNTGCQVFNRGVQN
jgi:hypothetical protein